MEPARVCDRCGGIVDVMVVPKRKAERRSPTPPWAIGACRSCGATFNPAGLLSLDPVGQDSDEPVH